MSIVFQRCLRFNADMITCSQFEIFQSNQEYYQMRTNRHIQQAHFNRSVSFFFVFYVFYRERLIEYNTHIHLITFHSDSRTITRMYFSI